MIGAIVGLIISIVLVLVIVLYSVRYFKKNGYNVQDQARGSNSKFAENYKKINGLEQNALELIPEVDDSMTDQQREEELLFLRHAWDADKTK